MVVLKQWFLLCLNSLSDYVDISTVKWVLYVFVSTSIFTRSFAVVLDLICIFCIFYLSLCDNTYHLPELNDSHIVLWCLYLHMIVCRDKSCTFGHLKIASTSGPDFFFFWGLGWFLTNFYTMLSKEAFNLKYIPRYITNYLTWCQLAYHKLLQE